MAEIKSFPLEKALPKSHQKGNLAQYLFWMTTWIILRSLLEIFCHFEIKGRENLIRLEKPFIFAMAMHGNRLDPWIVSAAIPNFLNRKFIPIRYMTYYTYIEAPVIGHFIKGYGAYPVKPGQGLEKVLKPSVDMLRNKEAIGIFPEGGLSKDGLMRDGKVGVAYLSAQTNAPIIPIYIGGSFGLNPFTLITFQKRIKVCFGKPLYQADLFKDKISVEQTDLQSATGVLMNQIASLSKL